MKSLKLNKINRNQLNADQMNKVNGGCTHHSTCACAWEGNGGSSSYDNGNENYDGGMHSLQPGGEKLYWC